MTVGQTISLSPPLLAIDRLAIHAGGQGGQLRPIVQGIDFTIDPGSVTAVVGESGSGKTMVGRAIIGLLPAGLSVTSGDIRLDGQSLTRLSDRDMRALRGAQIGMVFQEPMVSLNPTLRIGTQIMEALLHHRGLSPIEARAAALDALDRVGIVDPAGTFDAYPRQFSGGMRQRIMLASVLAMRPRLLIADEPTTALDAVMRKQVMDLMVELTTEIGTAVLLVSHDLGMVSRYADKVVVMRRGEQIEQGTPDQILGQPGHDYTRALVGAMPSRGSDEAGRGEGGAADPIVSAADLCIRYPGARRLFGRARPAKKAVENVSFDVRRGEVLAVVGESGSGKSTIGRALMHLLPPAGGSIRFDGVEVGKDRSGEAVAALRARAQMVFQDPNSSLDPRMRLDAIVAEGLRRQPGLSAAERRARSREMLAEVGLGGDFADRFPHQLSGGQRQRVAIARAIVGRPDFVVADEAVSALDVTVQAQILTLLSDLRARYSFAMMFISHDLAVVEQIADRVAVMYRGHLVEIGSRDDVFDRPQHPYTHRLLSATPRIERRTEGGYALVDTVIRPAEPPIGHRWYEPDAADSAERVMALISGAHFVGCAV